MLLMGSRGSKRTDADFRSGAIREIGPSANQVDNIMLFSGDGDFYSLLEAVQRRGVHVTVISSLRSKPPMIADELRRQADTFIELDDLKAAIGRTLNTVPPRAA